MSPQKVHVFTRHAFRANTNSNSPNILIRHSILANPTASAAVSAGLGVSLRALFSARRSARWICAVETL